MTDEAKPAGTTGAAKPLLKLTIELGPLLIFFAAYALAGIYWATGVLMVAAVIAIPASWRLLGHVSPVPVATAVLVVVFGGLTLWLDDPRFIKMKPTIINLLFAGVLMFGLWTRRPLLKMMFGEAFNLSEEGWQKLTVRWTVFFVLLAAVNELVWRNFSEAAWVDFKVFGILPLTMVFAMAQVGLIKRYELKTDA
ncbi:MAG TPA: septation protein A [Hyphomicrobiaceae bacterium]|jgi:intracellular septation protein|nr:septation protein A [Hyphomicrobiaceae bacterium]